MNKLLFMAVLAIGLVALIAPTSWAKNAVREMTNIQNEINEIDKETESLKAKLPGLGKLQRERLQELEQAKSEHDAIHTYYSSELSTYNSSCLGKELIGETYRRCKKEQENLQQYKNEKEPILRRIVKRAGEIERQYLETANEMTLIVARIQKIANYKSWLEKGLGILREYTIKMCFDVPVNVSDAELKLICGNVQMDGADPNLPSGDDLQPQPGGITITPN